MVDSTVSQAASPVPEPTDQDLDDDAQARSTSNEPGHVQSVLSKKRTARVAAKHLANLVRQAVAAPASPETKLSMPVVAQLIPSVMLALERIPNITGVERKAIMLDVLLTVAKETNPDEREHLVKFIKTVLPIIIDVVAAAMKGRIEISNYIQLPDADPGAAADAPYEPDKTEPPASMYN